MRRISPTVTLFSAKFLRECLLAKLQWTNSNIKMLFCARKTGTLEDIDLAKPDSRGVILASVEFYSALLASMDTSNTYSKQELFQCTYENVSKVLRHPPKTGPNPLRLGLITMVPTCPRTSVVSCAYLWSTIYQQPLSPHRLIQQLSRQW